MKIFDLHADIGTDLYDRHLKKETDVLRKNHLDKLDIGEVRGVAMACFFSGKQNWRTMTAMVENAQQELMANSDRVRWVAKTEDLIEDEKLLALISVEGMCGIKSRVNERVDWLYDHGVRIASLCWNEANALATGWPNDPLRGLTAMGKKAVSQMNERRMIIDVSHTNEKTFWDILSTSRTPVIATHSNARYLCDHQRNLTIQQIKAIGQTGGMIGLNAAKNFISVKTDEQTSQTLAKHASFMADLIGHQHLMIGFDYMDFFVDNEGNEESANAQDLKDATQSQNLIQALLDAGFSSQQVQDIAYGNIIEFFKKHL